MGWEMTGSMAFGAFAAVVQISLGTALAWRNPRNERVALFGLLFLANGIAAACVFLSSGFPEVRDGLGNNSPRLAVGFIRAGQFFDVSTNALLLLIGLVYPRRMQGLRRVPNMVLVFIAALVVLFVIRATTGEMMISGRRTWCPLTAPVALLVYGLNDLAFPLIMVRWAALWREDWSKEMRAQFGLVFAAIGVRAVHQIVFVVFVEVSDVLEGRTATTAGLWIGGAIALLNVMALLAALGMMFAAPARLRARDRRWTLLVIAFFLFGLVEAAVNATLDTKAAFRWWDAITGNFDVLVIRPVLIWFAVTRTQFLPVRLRSGNGAWTMAFILTAAAVMGGFFEAFGDKGSAVVQWSLSALIGIAVASIVLAIARSMVLVRSEDWARPQTSRQIYEAELDEALRNGRISLADEARLARLRASLGIDQAMHHAAVARLDAGVLPKKTAGLSVNRRALVRGP